MSWVKRGSLADGEEGLRDDYRLVNRCKCAPDGKLQCQICGKTTAIKSNRGIRELQRISAYRTPPEEPSCPADSCANHGVGVYKHPEA